VGGASFDDDEVADDVIAATDLDLWLPELPPLSFVEPEVDFVLLP
jgi:hypothetical protein